MNVPCAPGCASHDAHPDQGHPYQERTMREVYYQTQPGGNSLTVFVGEVPGEPLVRMQVKPYRQHARPEHSADIDDRTAVERLLKALALHVVTNGGRRR